MTLLVGCVPELPVQRLQSFVGALYALDPPVDADVTHLGTLEQVRRLQAGELDLGIIHPARAGLECEPLFAGERLAAFLPLGHRLATRSAVGPNDLVREDLLLFPRETDSGLHDRLLELFDTSGYRFRSLREIGGADLRDVLFAVAQGHGITLAPQSTQRVVGDLGDLLLRRSVEPPQWMPDTHVAWVRDRPETVQGLIPAVQEVARELRAADRAAPGG